MLPHFFRHYDSIVDAYFLFDYGSTDGTLELAARHDRVHVEKLEMLENSFVDHHRRMSDMVWQRSRGTADWVMLVDADEFLHRQDLVAYLSRSRAQGCTAIRSLGYEMVGDALPAAGEDLVDTVTLGCRSSGHSRLCIFSPDAIAATHFGPGRHRAWPEGHVVWPPNAEVLLLHYGHVDPDYLVERSAQKATLLRQGDLDQGWGSQYRWSAETIRANWARMSAAAAPVPGIGALRGVPPESYRGEEAIIDGSGLLDGDWYLAAYRDLAENMVDPLTHYCTYGWKEARWPNFYFDPNWYAKTYPEVAAAGGNALAHYILAGERKGNRPSPRFDPAWYRDRQGLAPEESPLRHYLEHRLSGQVSPLPDFDAEAYCRDHPEVLSEGRDPYEESLRGNQPAYAAPPAEPYPGFDAVLAALGLEPGSGAFPASVPWRSLVDVVRVFLRQYPVDEAWYRATYPDVDASIRSGQMHSALEHFVVHGYFERRRFRPS